MTPDNSSIFQVLPIENVLFAFSRALCNLTLPVFFTATMIILSLFEEGESGGCGV
jgi:hypothetical protein